MSNQESIFRMKGIKENNNNLNSQLINNNNLNSQPMNNNLNLNQNNINNDISNKINRNRNTNKNRNMNKNPQISHIKKKIISYFTNKYPTTFPTIGISNKDLEKLITNIVNKTNSKNTNNPNNLNNNNDSLKQNINNLISIFERKIKEKIYSENRLNSTVNTNKITLDPNIEMSYNKYVNQNFDPSKPKDNTLFNNSNLINNNNDSIHNAEKITQNKYDETNNYEEIYNTNIKKLVNKKMVDSGDSESYNNYHLQKADIENKLSKKDVDLLYTEERLFDYNIVLDSKDRDTTKFTNPAEFEIDFGGNSSDGGNSCKIDTVYGNVESIELLHVIVRNHDNISSLPYILLELKELGSNFNGTNNDLKNTFAVLSKYETIGTTTGEGALPGFNHYEKISNNADTQVKKIFNPRINLNKLTIKLKNPSGDTITFDNDVNALTSTVVSIGLRITTVQKNMGTNFINKAIS